MIKFKCRRCKEPMEAPSDLASTILKCPVCNYPQMVPTRKQKRVISTAFLFAVIYCFALTVGLCFFKDNMSVALFKTAGYGRIVFIGLVAVFFQALIFIPQTVIRLREKPGVYITLGMLRIFLLILFTVI